MLQDLEEHSCSPWGQVSGNLIDLQDSVARMRAFLTHVGATCHSPNHGRTPRAVLIASAPPRGQLVGWQGSCRCADHVIGLDQLDKLNDEC